MEIDTELAIIALQEANNVDADPIDVVKRAIDYYEFLTGGSTHFKRDADQNVIIKIMTKDKDTLTKENI